MFSDQIIRLKRAVSGRRCQIHEIKSSQSDFDQTLLRRTSCNDDKSYQTKVEKDHQHTGEKLSSKISGTLERSSSTDRVERRYLQGGEKLSSG